MHIQAFERKLNIMVGFPAGELWHGGFGMCLVNLCTHLMSAPVPGYRFQRMVPVQLKGSILSRSRAKLVQEARKQGCNKLLYIDTDQTFPRDTAHRLLQHDKNVIGCNIATKQIPATTTARRKSPHFWGEPVFTDPDSPSLEKVWRLGCGVMLLDLRVFEKIGLGCFEVKWIDEIQDYQGEDWSMCEALERCGIDIWVDHKLSNEIGHLGEYKYTHDVVGEKVLTEAKVIGEA
jgi:hypothetical protein